MIVFESAASLAAAAVGARMRALSRVAAIDDGADPFRYAARLGGARGFGLRGWKQLGIIPFEIIIRYFEKDVLKSPGRMLVPQQVAAPVDDSPKLRAAREAEMRAFGCDRRNPLAR